MNTTEVSRLVTYIEENLRSSQTAGLQFVDARNFRSQLDSRQNHVVFGRRGAGKTSLVNATRGSQEHIDIHLNLEDYKDITFPNIVIQVLVRMFDTLDGNIRSAYPWYRCSLRAKRVRSQIKSTKALLSEYLHQPDREVQEINTRDAYDHEASLVGR